MSGRFQRLDERERAAVMFTVDGEPVRGLEGDTLMVAMLAGGLALRDSEFGDGRRAGFCLMGACQDCWVWTEAGERLRACSAVVAPGLAISTHQPEVTWPDLK
ncbi:(2Fe-2S)-binding protein [Novosphingobium naphthalenivorans]|uniref:(2Fe-2S)-binding protein n=1 Tax=Novosphingobium naphthalenivorans TaxID=273168 RepID=UPI00083697DA|nr:(2Fe-2S)-binding protein [Novosphingobium naphthalenivorans]